MMLSQKSKLLKEDWRGEYYEFTSVVDVWADIRDDYVESPAWGLQFEEKSMTPNERLLRTASEIVVSWRKDGSEAPWGSWLLRLEAAVKACEAVEVSTTDAISGKGRMQWNDDKTGVCIENIQFVTNDIWVAVMDALNQLAGKKSTSTVWSGTMADVIKANATPTLTDQQRRMGLRSTRHVTNRSEWDD